MLFPAAKRLLFVCTANQHRSRTAEDLYRSDPWFEAVSAGTDVYEDDPDERPVTRELVEWADVIFVMEPYHREVLEARFPGCNRKVVVLHIPDRFYRSDPELVELLRRKLPEYV
jgi:predicted protein tyrosine phosphatase